MSLVAYSTFNISLGSITFVYKLIGHFGKVPYPLIKPFALLVISQPRAWLWHAISLKYCLCPSQTFLSLLTSTHAICPSSICGELAPLDLPIDNPLITSSDAIAFLKAVSIHFPS